MTEYGRHVRAALAEQSGVYRATHDPDQERKLYEQIGTLYQAMEAVDVSRFGDETAVRELADFLATVHAALRLGHFSPTYAALSTALRRYEADRGGA